MISRVYFIILVFFFISCEEVIEWYPKDIAENKLVVQAILTDENKHQEIYLTGLLDSINGESSGISGAFIEVKSETEIHLFWEDPQNKGRYLSSNSFEIEPGSNYELTIDWNQQKFEAITRAVESSLPMRSFSFATYQQSDSVYIEGIGVEYSESEQALYEFIIDWNYIIPSDTSRAKQVHYVFNSINIGQLFGPDKDQLVFPKGSIVFQRKYALSPDYAEYLRSLVVETQWKGGFFEESNGNLPTNISNGALGYFAACTVRNDTIIAE